MVLPVVHDPILLSAVSVPAGKDDMETVRDLLDTLSAHKDECVGMAANMIGKNVRIIAFDDGGKYTVMINPEIIRCDGAYEAEEGCLSLSGTRKVKRYRSIKVSYLNEEMKPRTKTYSGFSAQIIQHETDHCNGILI